MPTIGLKVCVTSCTIFSRRMTWRDLLLLFAGILPFLFAAVPAQADPSGAASHGLAVLLNEAPSNAMGERHPGSVSWRIDRARTAGRPDELVIHADIEIPEMRMTAMLDIRRNADKSLPASHVMEMTFALPRDVAGGKVISAPGVMMKFTERARGTPLSALTVKVTEGSFLAGLSNVDVDRARNIQLLKERAWFDIPIVYANQHRGILAVEKGFHGEEVFNEAMTAWEQPK
jgi:hypothetical protein